MRGANHTAADIQGALGGQDDTAAGIGNAIAGGSEHQQVTLGSFNGTQRSFAPLAIVDGTCTSAVRESAKGGAALAGWPTGATVTVGTVTDTGYSLLFGGTLAGTDVDPFTTAGNAALSVSDPSATAPGHLLNAGRRAADGDLRQDADVHALDDDAVSFRGRVPPGARPPVTGTRGAGPGPRRPRSGRGWRSRRT